MGSNSNAFTDDSLSFKHISGEFKINNKSYINNSLGVIDEMQESTFVPRYVLCYF